MLKFDSPSINKYFWHFSQVINLLKYLFISVGKTKSKDVNFQHYTHAHTPTYIYTGEHDKFCLTKLKYDEEKKSMKRKNKTKYETKKEKKKTLTHRHTYTATTHYTVQSHNYMWV